MTDLRKLQFAKMSGAGNDFVVFDNRDGRIRADRGELVRRACSRGLGIGADGVLVVEPSTCADFRMAYYNSDGGEAEMCGNGGRCISRYAYLNGIAGPTMTFETMAGLHHSEVVGENVKLGMMDPCGERMHIDLSLGADRGNDTITGSFINTGVPHFVVFVNDIERIDVRDLGSMIRYHSKFAPAGANADFVQIVDAHSIRIRTYERGVEDETLACGTGTVASAVLGAMSGRLVSPVTASTRSGLELKVSFRCNEGKVTDVYLEGDAKLVFEGTLLDPWILETVV